jgi:hypothetical protein
VFDTNMKKERVD